MLSHRSFGAAVFLSALTALRLVGAEGVSDAQYAAILRFVQEDQVADAAGAVSGLLLLHPGDARLLKLKASLAPQQAAPGEPAGSALSSAASPSSARSVPAAAPPAGAVVTAETLSGRDRIRYRAAEALLDEARGLSADPEARTAKFREFLERSAAIADAQPRLLRLHQLRAITALELDDARAGILASKALLALGAADIDDQALGLLLSKLELKGWLEAAEKNQISPDSPTAPPAASASARPPPLPNLPSATSGPARESTMDTKGVGVLNGVGVGEITQRFRDKWEVPARIKGALITTVEPDSSSARQGLRVGDIILELDRKPVNDPEEAVQLSEVIQGPKVLVFIWRNGRTLFVAIDESK